MDENMCGHAASSGNVHGIIVSESARYYGIRHATGQVGEVTYHLKDKVQVI